MVMPLTSTAGTPRGTGVDADGPTAEMRPFRTTTVAFSTGARAVPSITVAPTSAKLPVWMAGTSCVRRVKSAASFAAARFK